MHYLKNAELQIQSELIAFYLLFIYLYLEQFFRSCVDTEVPFDYEANLSYSLNTIYYLPDICCDNK